MSVSVLELIAAAQAGEAPLAAESAGYLVLAAADQTSGAPRRLSARLVMLTEEGGASNPAATLKPSASSALF
jgi:hypothetical protein